MRYKKEISFDGKVLEFSMEYNIFMEKEFEARISYIRTI